MPDKYCQCAKVFTPECLIYSELSVNILGTQVSLWMGVLLAVLVAQSHGFLNPKLSTWCVLLLNSLEYVFLIKAGNKKNEAHVDALGRVWQYCDSVQDFF